MQGNIRNLFPGGNTSEGFFSYYNYIISQEEANKIFCIKGGPGTGKSSLMKKLGQHFVLNGFDVEYHHCSSDNNSLDGVMIPDLKLAILDATSPHIVDPKNPGAVDTILNLSECWDENKLKENKFNIIKTNKLISDTFKRAYKYLKSAKLIHDSWSNFNSQAINMSKVYSLEENLKNKIFKNSINNCGKERHLFATAFTPNGIVTYIDSLYSNYKNIYVLDGEPGTFKSHILNFIKDEAIKRNLYVEVLHKPLIPEEIEHILIPDLNVAILTSNEINKKQFLGTQIYTRQLQNQEMLSKYATKINEEKEMFYILLNKALNIISGAKALHDKLESYYIPSMNFDMVDKKYEEVLNCFSKYENDFSKNTFKQNDNKPNLV